MPAFRVTETQAGQFWDRCLSFVADEPEPERSVRAGLRDRYIRDTLTDQDALDELAGSLVDDVDAAISAAEARFDHGDAIYDPDVLALLRAAQYMRAQLAEVYDPTQDSRPGLPVSPAAAAAAWRIDHGND